MTKEIEKLELGILSDVFRYRRVVDLKLPNHKRSRGKGQKERTNHKTVVSSLTSSSNGKISKSGIKRQHAFIASLFIEC